MALRSAVIEQSTSKVFSYISNKLDDKASRADTIARLEIALSRLDFVLEMTGKIAITSVSLLRSRKVLKRVHREGIELLNKHKPPEENDGHENIGQKVVVVRSSSSYLQRIADRAAAFSISSLVGWSKEKLSSSVAQTFERYADWAEKLLAQVDSRCPPPRLDPLRYPFLRHLLEGKTIRCKIIKNPSQSIGFYLHPVIDERRGVEVTLVYGYFDSRNPVECFFLHLILRISEDTDIIGISLECIQRVTSQFKLTAECAIGELMLLPNLQDTFHSCFHPPSFIKRGYGFLVEFERPDQICCNGNSHDETLGNISSMEIPEPVIRISFRCYISAPGNNLQNKCFKPHGVFAPHFPSLLGGEICVEYGGKKESRNGSVQQMEEIARSDALHYLVHEPEPTDFELLWFSEHGFASITLRQEMPRHGRRRVSKRKR